MKITARGDRATVAEVGFPGAEWLARTNSWRRHGDGVGFDLPCSFFRSKLNVEIALYLFCTSYSGFEWI